VNTKGTGKGTTIKRTYLLPVELIERLEAAAEREQRPVGRQLKIFLERALELYEAERGEKSPGNKRPTLRGALHIAA
jgi:hypothetical protein